MSYYYRNYRRPYYRYRRRHRKYKSLEIEQDLYRLIFSVGAVIVSFGSFASGPQSLFLGLIIWTGIFIGVFLGYKTFRRKALDKSHSITSSVSHADSFNNPKLNSERHGCKCYMDGLRDGEQDVAHLLAEGLDYKHYFIFNNLTIPFERSGSSQIDHVIVSRFGIFVIETKDFKGWIFGSKDGTHWTQSFPRGKFQFPNPLRQNWSHIMALRALMPFVPESVFENIVVFTASSEFRTEPIANVVRIEKLVDYIHQYKDGRLSEEEVLRVLGKISYVCQTIDISLSEHIQNLELHHSGPKV